MNPEFQRNLWLEASPRRVAWAAVVLALVFGAVAFVTSNDGGRSGPALAVTGMLVFVTCAIIWGGRAAGTAVLGEIADRTWEFQRLSALTPWSMTWGKLFGAASLGWLCGLVGVAVMVIVALANGQAERFWLLAFLLALAVLVQAVSMAAALIGVRKARAEGRVARAGGVMGGLVIGLFLLSTVAGTTGFRRGAGTQGLIDMFASQGFTRWWGFEAPAEVFRALAVAAFAAWALAGAWRLMRLELQMQNTPLVWPGFLAFLAVFSAGFLLDAGWPAALLGAAMAAALCAYAAAFAEPADRVRLRQFAGAVKRGDLARAAPMTPATVAPVALSILLVICAVAALGGRGMTGEVGVRHAAALLAFMVRDLGVIAFYRFGPRPQRGDFGAVVALALLYGVGGLVAGPLFAPVGDAPMLGFVSGAVQAAIAWWLAGRRIRAPEGQLTPAAPSAPASSPAS